MLNKIFKYDAKNIFCAIIPFYVLLIILATFTRLSGWISNKIAILSFLNIPIQFFFIVLIIVTIVLTMILLIKRFYKNLFSDEGYLTNTLPVTAKTHIISKLMISVLALWSTIIIILLALFLAYGSQQWIDSLQQLPTIIATELHISKTTFFIYIPFYITIAFLDNLFMIYLAIALGQLHNNNRLLFSGLYWFFLYMLGQVLSLMILGGLVLCNPSIWSQLSNNIVPIGFLHQLLIAISTLEIIITIIYFLVTTHLLDKKLNLE